MRYHAHSPGDLQEWHPKYFREGPESEKPPEVPGLKGWHRDDATDAPPVNVGKQWYGGWPREFLVDELLTANRWARWARRLYHGGIVALLVGLALLVTPPGGEGTWERWLLFAVAVAGALAEFLWIAAVTVGDQMKSLVDGSDKPTNLEEPGSDDEGDAGDRNVPPPTVAPH